MSHEGDTSALRGGTEKGYLNIPLPKVGSPMLDSVPCARSDRRLEIVQIGQAYVKGRIDLDQTYETDLQQRDVFGAKQSGRQVSTLTCNGTEAIFPLT